MHIIATIIIWWFIISIPASLLLGIIFLRRGNEPEKIIISKAPQSPMSMLQHHFQRVDQHQKAS